MGFTTFRFRRAAAALSLTCLGVSPLLAETSPLSIHPEGHGLEISGHTSRERAMGEAGMAAINRRGPSLYNPSRTAWNEKTSFAATLDTDVDWIRDEETSNRTSSFVIPEIALNFQTKWPVNIGFHYRQRYQRDFSFTPMDPASPEAIQSFSAEGGLYELAATLAYAPTSFLALSLGYNLMLGRERIIESAVFNREPGSPDLFNGANLEGDTLSIRSSGGYPSVSATFRNRNFSLAASGRLEATLERTLERSITHVPSSQKTTDERDLPWSAMVGGAYKLRANQTLVADFSYESWDNAVSELLNPALRAGAGYEYQGTGGPYERYGRKIAYRGGLGFERLYLNETDMYFLTVGTGLPLGRRGNMLDVALKYGHRGSLENNLWTEDFLKLSVTLTGVSVWGQPVRKRR